MEVTRRARELDPNQTIKERATTTSLTSMWPATSFVLYLASSRHLPENSGAFG